MLQHSIQHETVMNTLELKTLSEINAVAREFLNLIGNRKIIAFYAEMGAGKTTFIKALCEELGVIDLVNSPTFSIVNDYLTKTNQHIYHFDFYRLETVSDAINIGTEEYLYSGNICLIEWPNIAEDLLPDTALKVQIKVNSESTRIFEF